MRSELPVGVAAIIGCERERAEVSDLVVAARVVTLTGPGGCGKTRLAVEVVGDVASRFPDGACWVDLQGVSEPGLVAAAIGMAIGSGTFTDAELAQKLHISTNTVQTHVKHLLRKTGLNRRQDLMAVAYLLESNDLSGSQTRNHQHW